VEKGALVFGLTGRVSESWTKERGFQRESRLRKRGISCCAAGMGVAAAVAVTVVAVCWRTPQGKGVFFLFFFFKKEGVSEEDKASYVITLL